MGRLRLTDLLLGLMQACHHSEQTRDHFVIREGTVYYMVSEEASNCHIPANRSPAEHQHDVNDVDYE